MEQSIINGKPLHSAKVVELKDWLQRSQWEKKG